MRERRWWAVGDPQAPFERFLAILERHELLGSDGRLRDEVGLVSMGDHFDYGTGPDYAEVGRNGERILTWLAEHPSDQVVILFGNHDSARVQELAFESDASFTRARLAAQRIQTSSGEEEALATDAFHAEFPRIPTPGLAARDFSAFSESQRKLVQRLLMNGRFTLAVTGQVHGAHVLLNHAGVTKEQLELLGLREDAKPEAMAQALNSFLRERVAKVKDAWLRGENAALELEPLHVAGRTREEGGGLLYHRPSNPERPGADTEWEFKRGRARRYSPRSLPLGLVQACGHSGHKKLRLELQPWVSDDALQVTRGGLRTLTHLPDGRVSYRMGIHPPEPGAGVLYFLDAEMNWPEQPDYPLLKLHGVDAGA